MTLLTPKLRDLTPLRHQPHAVEAGWEVCGGDVQAEGRRGRAQPGMVHRVADAAWIGAKAKEKLIVLAA